MGQPHKDQASSDELRSNVLLSFLQDKLQEVCNFTARPFPSLSALLNELLTDFVFALWHPNLAVTKSRPASIRTWTTLWSSTWCTLICDIYFVIL